MGEQGTVRRRRGARAAGVGVVATGSVTMAGMGSCLRGMPWIWL
jgi:hypothetical protein